MFGRLLPVASLAAVLALTGCSGPRAAAAPSPAPSGVSHHSMFPTDDAALSAASESYRDYVATADVIAMDGGQDASRIAEFAADDALKSDLDAFAQYRVNETRNIGSTALEAFRLQSVIQEPHSTDVVISVCEDISGVDVVDRSGTSIVAPGRLSRIGYEATVSFASASDAKVTARGILPGSTSCS
jgi:hypothetical protein